MSDRTASPLTLLSEEEDMFYSTMRQFAEETITPLVRSMEDEQQLAPGTVNRLFELGLRGIEIPDEMGGAGASFFDAVLAIEGLSSVDAGVGVGSREGRKPSNAQLLH